LLLASTSSIYGANPTIPFAEHHRADEPLSLYAATKKGMEAMAHSYAHLFDIPTTVFRFFTVFGPLGRPDMALFRFVDAILAGRPIDVYGHGRMARDFTYIDDLVEAIIRLIPVIPGEENRVTCPGVTDTLSLQGPYRTVNIAGGHPVPLMDFIGTIEHCLGTTADLHMTDMQPGDVPSTFADPALLKALTGYVPDTPVAAGVAAFVRWYRDWSEGKASGTLSNAA
jgi:UDP-glucuronate 4-epimerase